MPATPADHGGRKKGRGEGLQPLSTSGPHPGGWGYYIFNVLDAAKKCLADWVGVADDEARHFAMLSKAHNARSMSIAS